MTITIFNPFIGDMKQKTTCWKQISRSVQGYVPINKSGYRINRDDNHIQGNTYYVVIGDKKMTNTC